MNYEVFSIINRNRDRECKGIVLDIPYTKYTFVFFLSFKMQWIELFKDYPLGWFHVGALKKLPDRF